MTKKINKTPALFIFFILILLSFFSGCIKEQNISGEDFSFTTLDGETKHLSDYKGKVVILDMWATWCQPCQLQMLELRKVYQNYSRNDLEILSIDIDQREITEQIQRFLDEYRDYGYELTWIFGKDNGTIWENYKVGSGGIPALCIFDKNGNLSFSHEGLAVFSEVPEGASSDITKLAPVIDSILNKNK